MTETFIEMMNVNITHTHTHTHTHIYIYNRNIYIRNNRNFRCWAILDKHQKRKYEINFFFFFFFLPITYINKSLISKPFLFMFHFRSNKIFWRILHIDSEIWELWSKSIETEALILGLEIQMKTCVQQSNFYNNVVMSWRLNWCVCVCDGYFTFAPFSLW